MYASCASGFAGRRIRTTDGVGAIQIGSGSHRATHSDHRPREGESNTRIAELVDVTRQTVITWWVRYDDAGTKGLVDEARSGRPRTIDHRKIVSETLMPPPKKLGVTHWSTCLFAERLLTNNSTVAEMWHGCGVKACRSETFNFSTAPEPVAKVIDIAGLYFGLEPPENAIVLCVDEKFQIQALDRTAPTLPMQIGIPEKQTHDYVRNGTTTLFAALEIATGKVTGICRPRGTATTNLWCSSNLLCGRIGSGIASGDG